MIRMTTRSSIREPRSFASPPRGEFAVTPCFWPRIPVSTRQGEALGFCRAPWPSVQPPRTALAEGAEGWRSRRSRAARVGLPVTGEPGGVRGVSDHWLELQVGVAGVQGYSHEPAQPAAACAAIATTRPTAHGRPSPKAFRPLVSTRAPRVFALARRSLASGLCTYGAPFFSLRSFSAWPRSPRRSRVQATTRASGAHRRRAFHRPRIPSERRRPLPAAPMRRSRSRQ